MPTSFLFQSGQAHLVSKFTLFGGLWDCSVSTAKNANFGSSRAIEFLFLNTNYFCVTKQTFGSTHNNIFLQTMGGARAEHKNMYK